MVKRSDATNATIVNAEARVAKCDHRLALTSLFASGGPKRPIDAARVVMLKLEYRSTDGLKVSCRFPEHISVGHETVLLALLHIAEHGANGRRSRNAGTVSSGGGTLREVGGIASGEGYWTIETTAAEIMKTMGLKPLKRNNDRLQRQLIDLSQIHLTVEADGVTGASTILGFAWDRDRRGRIYVDLCWRLAAILGGANDRLYALVNLDERAQLCDVGKALHRWISANYWGGRRPSEMREYKLDTLVQHAWREATTEGTKRRRRHDVVKAMVAIGELPGWSVSMVKDMIQVQRTS